MRRHEIALHYASKAINILEPEYEKRYPNNMGSEMERKNFRKNFVSIVASAYHNAAVEQEYNFDFSTSLILY